MAQSRQVNFEGVLELNLPELVVQAPKERRMFDAVSMHNAIMGSGATLFLVGLWLLQRH